MNDNEDYYYDRINNLAQLNTKSINRFNYEVITKNMIITDVMHTETKAKGNSYVNFLYPFIVRANTVSKDYNSGAMISNGGLSIENGNLYILGEKNIYNFFQDSIIINNIVSYEGINVKKNTKIKEIYSLYPTSNIIVNKNINNENNTIANIGNVIAKGSIKVNNKIFAEDIISNGNIEIPNIDTNNIYNTNNIITGNIKTRIGTFNDMTIGNGIFYDMTINKLKNDNGNVDGNILSVLEMYDYNNIYIKGNINTIGIIKEITYISNLNIIKSIITNTNIYANNIVGNIISVSGTSNLTGTTRIKNNIDTKNIKINQLICSNLDILSGIPTSSISNINCSGNIIIYNLFDVRDKISTQDVKITSYKDNLIPLNLYDSFGNVDSGIIYSMPMENVGLLYRKKINPIDYLNKSENKFILGKLDDNNKIIGLSDLNVEDVYGNIYGNSINIGLITGNTIIGNKESKVNINSILNISGRSIISNVYVFKNIKSNLIIDKTLIANVIYSSFIDGPSTEISNIDPTNLTYTNIDSEDFRANTINVDGNIKINNTKYEFNKGNGILNLLEGNNININNTLISENVYTKNQVNTIDYSRDKSYGGKCLVKGNIYYTEYELNINKNIEGNYRYNDIENVNKNINIQKINNMIRTFYNGNRSIIDMNGNIIIDYDNIIYNEKPYRMRYDKSRINYINLVGNIILKESINDIVSSNILIGIDCVGNNYVYDSGFNLVIRRAKINKTEGTRSISIYGNMIIMGDSSYNSNNGNIVIYGYNNGVMGIIRNVNGINRFGYNVRINDRNYIVSGINYVNVYDMNGIIIKQYTGVNNFGKSISISRKYIGIADDNNVYIYYNLTDNIREQYNNSGNVEVKNNNVIINGNVYNNGKLKFISNNKISMYDNNIYEINNKIKIYNMKKGGINEYSIENNGENIMVGEKYMYLGKSGNLYIYK
jgi:hypothetical protein